MFQVLISSLALLVALIALARAFQDYKYIKKGKAQLERQINDLKRILKFRGNLASEIAHEIKNPITAILCSAETLDLILADKLDDNQRLTLRYIKEYGDNLHKLVSDFLDLSRAEAGNMDSRPDKVNLSSAVQSVVGLLQAIASRKGIKLLNQTEGKDFYVFCDPVHLKQILFNLIHNGIKFTKKSGQITVSCTKAAESKKVLISVEDNGAGISEEKLKTLFDPYVKYEGAVKETLLITESGVPQTGVGIGLAICKSLVELAGGHIKVSSVPGKGSIFSFTLNDTEAPSNEIQPKNEMEPKQEELKSHQSYQDRRPEH
jgi:signal transduction histidine kinase